MSTFFEQLQADTREARERFMRIEQLLRGSRATVTGSLLNRHLSFTKVRIPLDWARWSPVPFDSVSGARCTGKQAPSSGWAVIQRIRPTDY